MARDDVRLIDRKLRSLRDPELGDDVLARVGAWAAALRGALPGLRGRLESVLAELTASSDDVGRAAAAYPAGHGLDRWRQGRLSPTHLGCATPRDVVTLGAALGVSLAAEPL